MLAELRVLISPDVHKAAGHIANVLGPRAHDVACGLATLFARRADARNAQIWRDIASAIELRRNLRFVVGKDWGPDSGPDSGKQ